jgi:hypothetical protein
MQFGQLKRREFIALLGGTASEWPLLAQQAANAGDRFPHNGSPDQFTHLVAAFQQSLKEED